MWTLEAARPAPEKPKPALNRHRGSRRLGPVLALVTDLYTKPGGFVIASNSYKEAGVDIDAGADLVEEIKPLARATVRAGVCGELGGFGALFDTKAAGYRDPILVAATDGVGTKLKIAIETGRHDTVGIDLVAMCVNDLVVQGAEPLFFLDYFATGALDVGVASAVVKGIAEGCKQAECALIGGETAELPGMYAAGDYDLAGFAVGAAERGRLLDGSAVRVGDVILGMASGGIHANGFALVRRIVASRGLAYDAPAPFDPVRSLGAALLAPTRIYVAACLAAHRRGEVRAFAHITGGGLLENLPRVLPHGLGATLDASTWQVPDVFAWLADAGDIDRDTMARTFNCGIGMVAIVAPEHAETVAGFLGDAGETVHRIGVVTADGGGRATIEGWTDSWPG